MSRERHERLTAVLARARRLDPAEREAFLAEACADDGDLRAEVEALLAAGEGSRARGLEERFQERVGELAADVATGSGTALPERIGPYRVQRLLGTGGMGVVYEGLQERPRRTVALKVMQGIGMSPAHLRRFEVETHVLGQLRHPGIAQIYEAGTDTSGGTPCPYFAMELVEGVPLTEHAVTQGLDVRRRVELLLAVCDAVQHAHQKGVIHRDLKPANILVDATGQPRILDFGVARATDADTLSTTLRTSAGELVGTLPYMSPEQASGDPSLLDTRADVYALGVLLYELLAGRLPLEVDTRSIPEAVRTILEREPEPLGRVRPELAGDLATIAAKAMEKAKERRYASASELAADLRRHLRHEPVLARPASRVYQLRRFARRNRLLVGAVLAVLVVLAAGAAVSSVLAVREGRARVRAEEARADARREARRATAEAERAARAEAEARSEARRATAEAERATRAREEARREALRATAEAERASREASVAGETADFLVGLFEVADPGEARGNAITARQILDEGAERIRSELGGSPEVKARLLAVMGQVHRNLGLHRPALELASEALELRLELFGEESLPVADSREDVGLVLSSLRELAPAEEALRQALETRRALLGAEHVLVVEAMQNLASVLLHRGDYGGSRELFSESFALLDRAGEAGVESVQLANALHSLGVVEYRLGNDREAVEHYRRALAMNLRLRGDDHPSVAVGRSALGLSLRELGELDEAEEVLRSGYELSLRIWGPDSPQVAPVTNNLALVLQDRGRHPEAEAIFRHLLRLDEAQYGRGHLYVAVDLNNLAIVLGQRGEHDEALACLGEALEIRERLLAPDHLLLLTTHFNLAEELRATARHAEAADAYARALDGRRRALGPDHRDTLRAARGLAESFLALDRFAEAERVLLDALGAPASAASGATRPTGDAGATPAVGATGASGNGGATADGGSTGSPGSTGSTGSPGSTGAPGAPADPPGSPGPEPVPDVVPGVAVQRARLRELAVRLYTRWGRPDRAAAWSD